jgi:hypothetical protein
METRAVKTANGYKLICLEDVDLQRADRGCVRGLGQVGRGGKIRGFIPRRV